MNKFSDSFGNNKNILSIQEVKLFFNGVLISVLFILKIILDMLRPPMYVCLFACI